MLRIRPDRGAFSLHHQGTNETLKLNCGFLPDPRSPYPDSRRVLLDLQKRSQKLNPSIQRIMTDSDRLLVERVYSADTPTSIVSLDTHRVLIGNGATFDLLGDDPDQVLNRNIRRAWCTPQQLRNPEVALLLRDNPSWLPPHMAEFFDTLGLNRARLEGMRFESIPPNETVLTYPGWEILPVNGSTVGTYGLWTSRITLCKFMGVPARLMQMENRQFSEVDFLG